MNKLIFILLFFFNSLQAGHVENVIYGESGSNYKDAWYVAQVINNRYKHGNYNSLYSVVTEKGQFSGYKVINDQKILDSLECIVHRVQHNDIPEELRLPENTRFFCNPLQVKSKRAKRWFNKLNLVKISEFKQKYLVHYYYSK